MSDMDLNKENGQLSENGLNNLQNDKILNTNNNDESFEINTFHPWKRFLALWIDGSLLGMFACFGNAFQINSSINFYVSFLFYFLFYSLCIGLTGTSPGKKVFGIRVVDDNNNLIGFVKGLKRTFLTLFFATWFLGFIWTLIKLAFPNYWRNVEYQLLSPNILIIVIVILIFILQNVPLLLSYFYYKKHGKTKWDEILNTNVVFKKKLNRANKGCLIIFVISQIISVVIVIIILWFGFCVMSALSHHDPCEPQYWRLICGDRHHSMAHKYCDERHSLSHSKRGMK